MRSENELRQMRQPTAKLVGSSLGDAIGIGWFLRDIGIVRAFGYAGPADGQFTEVLIVPDKDFAVVTIANSGPENGLAFNGEIVQAGLEGVAGVTVRKAEVRSGATSGGSPRSTRATGHVRPATRAGPASQ